MRMFRRRTASQNTLQRRCLWQRSSRSARQTGYRCLPLGPLCDPMGFVGTTGRKRISSNLIWTACPRHSDSARSISCPRQRRP